MSPEQLQVGSRVPSTRKVSICVDVQDTRVTLKSDTFSFGVLMWEMATRMLPWQGLGLLAVSNPMTALSVELAEQSDDEPAACA